MSYHCVGDGCFTWSSCGQYKNSARIFGCQGDSLIHLLEEHVGRRFACPFCGTYFKRKQEFMFHWTYRHPRFKFPDDTQLGLSALDAKTRKTIDDLYLKLIVFFPSTKLDGSMDKYRWLCAAQIHSIRPKREENVPKLNKKAHCDFFDDPDRNRCKVVVGPDGVLMEQKLMADGAVGKKRDRCCILS